MSDDTPKVNIAELEETKTGLSHVETKVKKSATRPVFKCGNCGHVDDIPYELLAKMENDEDISSSIPSHCGSRMILSVME